MARGNDAQQRELVEILDLGSATRLLEIGYGPGELAALVLDRAGELEYVGVDPSDVMHQAAQRRNSGAVADGRAVFKIGAAAKMPVADGHFDRVVSVNNIRLWPDIATAASEIARVLDPTTGRAVISWHSQHSPSLIQRRLGVSEDELDRIGEQLGTALDVTERMALRSSAAFIAEISSSAV